MKIEIEIPDYFRDSCYPLVNINSEDFYYTNDKVYYGFQHNLQDENEAKKLESKLQKITEVVHEMINEDLI